MLQGTELAQIFNVKPQSINNLRTRYDLIENEDTIIEGKARRIYTPAGIRKILTKRNYEFVRRNICVCNVKGGVGKTTISVHIAKKAAALGFKTLLIDCDKQGNATDQLWPDGRERDFKCLYDIVKKEVLLDDVIVKLNDYLSLLPSNLKNQLLENEITNTNINKGNYFKRLLANKEYDLVIFDTEPNLSQINLMALAYSDLNIAPVRLDKNSVDGLDLLLNFLEEQSSEWPEMRVQTKALINGYDGRMRTDSIHKISEISELEVQTFNNAIRIDQSFVKAQDGVDIKKGSKAYEDITNLVSEILELNSVTSITKQ